MTTEIQAPSIRFITKINYNLLVKIGSIRSIPHSISYNYGQPSSDKSPEKIIKDIHKYYGKTVTAALTSQFSVMVLESNVIEVFSDLVLTCKVPYKICRESDCGSYNCLSRINSEIMTTDELKNIPGSSLNPNRCKCRIAKELARNFLDLAKMQELRQQITK